MSLAHTQIKGLVLNQSHYICPSCDTPHHIFGNPDRFRATASELSVPIIGMLPVLSDVSESGDRGVPIVLTGSGKDKSESVRGVEEWKETMSSIADRVGDCDA